MNGAHIHLVVNHLPIVAVIIGTLVLIAGYLFKNNSIKKTALGINIFSAITSIAAFLSGEPAEEVIENIKNGQEGLIHAHEEFAELFLILSIILGVISIITLILSIKEKPYAGYGFIVVLGLSLALIIIGKQVGTSGGEISHPEIRSIQVE